MFETTLSLEILCIRCGKSERVNKHIRLTALINGIHYCADCKEKMTLDIPSGILYSIKEGMVDHITILK